MLLKAAIRIEASFGPPTLAHIHNSEAQIEIEKGNRKQSNQLEHLQKLQKKKRGITQKFTEAKQEGEE